MKYETAELKGVLLDASVAKAEGLDVVPRGHGLTRWDQDHGVWRGWNPSTDWRDGGPIIERERMLVAPHAVDGWAAWPSAGGGAVLGTLQHVGPTPLIAAMRAYVASKFGDTVELT
jgi:hypothetical protein